MSARETKRRAVESVCWYHTIDFGDGIRSRGLDNNTARLATIGMPDDLTGWSVLDIGAWDGFFSFEAERRGAARVLATDSAAWDGTMGTKEGFELARRLLSSKVEDLFAAPAELTPERVGTFDLVLFLGVLYHLQDPVSAVVRLNSVTRRLAIVETVVDCLNCRFPAAALYPGRELDDDPTNWWGPNPQAVEALLLASGFTYVTRVYQPSWWSRLGAAVKGRLRRKEPIARTFWRTRAAFHAWKDAADPLLCRLQNR